MRGIRFGWVCRNIHFNTIERVELTDMMILRKEYPSWIVSDNCQIIAKILPTGLLDKNGLEIYEGDILKIKYLYEVVFYAGAFILKRISNQGNIQKRLIRSIREVHLNDRYEIIGNIYEHPELLEGKP